MIAPSLIKTSLFAFLVFLAAGTVRAQSEAPAGTYGAISNTVAATSNYYSFTEEGAPTVRVELWGEIGAPGLYDVLAGTDLRTLLTLAGGLSELNSATIRSSNKVIVIRDGEVSRFTATSVDGVAILSDEPFLLYDGDSVYIESTQKRKFTIRDGITIVASILGVLITYDRLVNG